MGLLALGPTPSSLSPLNTSLTPLDPSTPSAHPTTFTPHTFLDSCFVLLLILPAPWCPWRLPTEVITAALTAKLDSNFPVKKQNRFSQVFNGPGVAGAVL